MVYYSYPECNYKALQIEINDDLDGMAQSYFAGILIAGKVAPLIGQFAGKVAESEWSGTGATVEIVFSLLAAVLIGLGFGFIVRGIWGQAHYTEACVPLHESYLTVNPCR